MLPCGAELERNGSSTTSGSDHARCARALIHSCWIRYEPLLLFISLDAVAPSRRTALRMWLTNAPETGMT